MIARPRLETILDRDWVLALALAFFVAVVVWFARSVQDFFGGSTGDVLLPAFAGQTINDATAECQNLVCLRPAGSPLDAGLGFCSSPCTPANSSPNSPSDDCSGASMPLVCRSADLDPSFIAEVLDAGGSALLERYLGGTSAPILCTTRVDAGSS